MEWSLEWKEYGVESGMEEHGVESGIEGTWSRVWNGRNME